MLSSTTCYFLSVVSNVVVIYLSLLLSRSTPTHQCIICSSSSYQSVLSASSSEWWSQSPLRLLFSFFFLARLLSSSSEESSRTMTSTSLENNAGSGKAPRRDWTLFSYAESPIVGRILSSKFKAFSNSSIFAIRMPTLQVCSMALATRTFAQMLRFRLSPCLVVIAIGGCDTAVDTSTAWRIAGCCLVLYLDGYWRWIHCSFLLSKELLVLCNLNLSLQQRRPRFGGIIGIVKDVSHHRSQVFIATPVEKAVQNWLQNNSRAIQQVASLKQRVKEANIIMEQEGAEQPQQHVPPPPHVVEAAMVLTCTSQQPEHACVKQHPISMRLKERTRRASKIYMHFYFITKITGWMACWIVCWCW